MRFLDFVTVCNQSYNCQNSHYLGRNRVFRPFLKFLCYNFLGVISKWPFQDTKGNKWIIANYYTANPYRDSAGPEQGFPVQYFHTGKNLFSVAGIPVMKTGFSLMEILHREIPVLITGVGLQFKQDRYNFYGPHGTQIIYVTRRIIHLTKYLIMFA